MKRGQGGSFFFALVFWAVALCFPGTCFCAYTMSFEVFTDNGPWGVNGANFGDARLNLSVEVYNGEQSAGFKFYNSSDSSLGDVAITDIYFDDGTLLEISEVINGPGVLFNKLANPAELPGARLLDPDFVTTDQFSADSNPPVLSNGIQSGEWVIIRFDLYPEGTLEEVIRQLNDGTVRIGIHIQSFPGGFSESAVAVPEPATLCLFGLGALALFRKRSA